MSFFLKLPNPGFGSFKRIERGVDGSCKPAQRRLRNRRDHSHPASRNGSSHRHRRWFGRQCRPVHRYGRPRPHLPGRHSALRYGAAQPGYAPRGLGWLLGLPLQRRPSSTASPTPTSAARGCPTTATFCSCRSPGTSFLTTVSAPHRRGLRLPLRQGDRGSGSRLVRRPPRGLRHRCAADSDRKSRAPPVRLSRRSARASHHRPRAPRSGHRLFTPGHQRSRGRRPPPFRCLGTGPGCLLRRPILTTILCGDVLPDSNHDEDSATGTEVEAAFSFAGAGGELLVKVGISAVDVDGARRNLDAELPGWDFDATRKAANTAWNDARR